MGGLEAAWGVSGRSRWRALLFLHVLWTPLDDPEVTGGYRDLSLQNSAASDLQLVGGVSKLAPHTLGTAHAMCRE